MSSLEDLLLSSDFDLEKMLCHFFSTSKEDLAGRAPNPLQKATKVNASVSSALQLGFLFEGVLCGSIVCIHLHVFLLFNRRAHFLMRKFGDY